MATQKAALRFNGKRIATESDLWAAFDWSEGTRSNMPSLSVRQSGCKADAAPHRWSAAVRRLQYAIRTVAQLLFVNDADTLISDAMKGLPQQSSRDDEREQRMLAALIAITQNAPKGSGEKRTARAILCHSVGARGIRQLTAARRMTLGWESRDSAARDYMCLQSGNKLKKTRRAVRRFDTAAV